jgi:hypothetical protein
MAELRKDFAVEEKEFFCFLIPIHTMGTEPRGLSGREFFLSGVDFFLRKSVTSTAEEKRVCRSTC